jgi:hypothetical protein
MMGKGDLPDSAVYHADITCNRGVKYIWTGRVTSVIGQDTARTFSGIFNYRYPLLSAKTITKEVVKIILGKLGSNKYSLHKSNQLCSHRKLRDGQTVTEFIRTNPYWGGVDQSETAYGLHNVLGDKFLRKLVNSKGYAILYTHLGKVKNKNEPFEEKARSGFLKLAEYYRHGDILVATTRRLLDYYNMTKNVKGTITSKDNEVEINLTGTVEEQELNGLTIYIEDSRSNIVVRYNDKLLSGFEVNSGDESGQASVMLNWERLKYPL